MKNASLLCFKAQYQLRVEKNPPQIYENGKFVTKISMLMEQDLTMKV
jgi:hypothetical protein